jgi:hypothetical protein
MVSFAHRTHLSFPFKIKCCVNRLRPPALRDIFPEEFRKNNSLLFRTIGFGATFNAFDEIFTRVLSEHGSFKVQDIKKLVGLISDYEIADWEEFGTGNKAEQLAAQDFLTSLRKAIKATSKKETSGKIAL